jgi:hypothetical protein
MARGYARVFHFLFLSGSQFGETFHDDAHGVFMTFARYTRTREDDSQPVVEGTMKQTALMLHQMLLLHALAENRSKRRQAEAFSKSSTV